MVEATSGELPILYEPRDDFGLGSEQDTKKSIERLLPPSEATIREFIGRRDLMDTLWQWLVFDEEPRYFLYGRGGSGKSTIAYDFARRVSEHGGDIILSNGQKIDLVLFLSAKERYLDTRKARIVSIPTTDFTNAREQFEAILQKSVGFGEEHFEELSDKGVENRLKEMMDIFTLLIVIDDIDALITKSVDTGSDKLFRLLTTSSKGGKVLYTMREEASLSSAHSKIVPGLDPNLEYFEFVEACCQQFGVAHPSPDLLFGKFAQTSEYLPLVIETIIGFRRTTGSYQEAIDLWESKRGEEAREYLFRREYDRLSKDNRSRNFLFVLALFDKPVTSSVLVSLLQCTPNQLEDSIAQTKDLFLTIDHAAEASTLYSVGAVTRAFILRVSVALPHYEVLNERFKYFQSERFPSTPEVSAVIYQIDRRLGEDDTIGACEYIESLVAPATVSEHPRFKKAAGEVYARQQPPNLDKARNYFRAVYDADFLDRSMMRTWFYMELDQGLFSKAEEICRNVINNEGFSFAAISEFWSKAGMSRKNEARQTRSVSPGKSAKKYVSALNAYVSALDISHQNERLDIAKTEKFFLECLDEFVVHCVRFNLHEEFFDFWSRTTFSPKWGFDALRKHISLVCDKVSYGAPHDLRSKRGALHKLRNKIGSDTTHFGSEPLREEIVSIIDDSIKDIEKSIQWKALEMSW